LRLGALVIASNMLPVRPIAQALVLTYGYCRLTI
jgi:hypothetical protein